MGSGPNIRCCTLFLLAYPFKPSVHWSFPCLAPDLSPQLRIYIPKYQQHRSIVYVLISILFKADLTIFFSKTFTRNGKTNHVLPTWMPETRCLPHSSFPLWSTSNQLPSCCLLELLIISQICLFSSSPLFLMHGTIFFSLWDCSRLYLPVSLPA